MIYGMAPPKLLLYQTKKGLASRVLMSVVCILLVNIWYMNDSSFGTISVRNMICLISWTDDEMVLTHWGRMTHICVSKLSILGSDNGLSPGRRQAII